MKFIGLDAGSVSVTKYIFSSSVTGISGRSVASIPDMMPAHAIITQAYSLHKIFTPLKSIFEPPSS